MPSAPPLRPPGGHGQGDVRAHRALKKGTRWGHGQRPLARHECAPLRRKKSDAGEPLQVGSPPDYWPDPTRCPKCSPGDPYCLWITTRADYGVCTRHLAYWRFWLNRTNWRRASRMLEELAELERVEP